MRRRSFHSTSVASSSSPHLDPPANPHPRQTLDRIRILWHRIRALLEVLLALRKIVIATTEVQLKGRYQGHKYGINDARSM
ncbi:unnamed protein product [Musa acuminata subsp. malaccensis]|uniref:(wild Malaysian banana) hypothetical protein n=1 Tax=Musa acuminata subsp. malaccensis TaxID=214687 RepID=A0A804IHR1_MUSAM|nr:unnamed protein product [Musa acuminata subsp. malaccensis]